MINTLDFVEVWRDFHPSDKQFTWSSADGKIKCRLDYWLISRDVLPFAQSSEIIVIPHCDHAAVTLAFCTQKQHPRGPGFWKFNASLLEDKHFIESLSAKIPAFKEQIPRCW